MNSNIKYVFSYLLYGKGIVQISWCWRIDSEDHLLHLFVIFWWIYRNRFLLDFLIIEVIEAMLV